MFRQKKRLIFWGLCTAWFPLLLIGCSAKQELSPPAYDMVKALFSICNRKDAEGLAKVKGQLDEAVAGNTISSGEASSLKSIIAAAEAGNWDKGISQARSLMEQQQSRTPKPSAENQMIKPRGGDRAE